MRGRQHQKWSQWSRETHVARPWILLELHEICSEEMESQMNTTSSDMLWIWKLSTHMKAHMTSMPWFWVEQSLGSKLLPPTEWTIKSGVLTLLCLWYISKRKKKSTAEKLQVFEILFLSSKINKPIIYDSGKSEMDKTGIYLLV